MAALTMAHVVGPELPVLLKLTLGDLLRDATQRSPSQLALRCDRAGSDGSTAWTYTELLEQSEHCARRLLTMLSPGDRVAIWSDNRPEWLVLMFGAALAGLIVVTVNPALKAQEARYVLDQSRSTACFAAREYRGTALASIVRELQPSLASLRHVVDFDDWLDFIAGPVRDGDLPRVAPDEPVMIQYTSGTTGFPKGALLLHGRLTNNAAHTAVRAQVGENTTWVSALPFFHTGGSVMTAMAAISRRATLVMLSAWSPEAAMRLIKEHRAVVLSAVPTMLIALMAHEDVSRRNLTSLRRVITGGSPVSADLIRALQQGLGVEVYVVFGQTESGPVATMTNADDTPEDKQNTVGTPLPGYEVRIVDPDSGQTLRIGERGEFVVRGGNMAGYFDNEAATRAALDDEGWLHSGDICSVDERGYVRVEGRLKDMIIRGGENIYPREIEELLSLEPSIREVAVVGLPDEKWGEVVGAFLVPSPQANFDKVALTDQLRGSLARFKVPQHWILLDELPRTATGKVQKFVLRDRWRSGGYRES